MNTTAQLERLRKLESAAHRLRDRLEISRPGEVIFQAPRNRWSEDDVVVEADGLGGGTLLIIQGNYPIDFSTKLEQKFDSEQQACDAAEALSVP